MVRLVAKRDHGLCKTYVHDIPRVLTRQMPLLTQSGMSGNRIKVLGTSIDPDRGMVDGSNDYKLMFGQQICAVQYPCRSTSHQSA